MTTPEIELIYFDGCPNADRARDNLRAAVNQSSEDLEWSEWNLMAESTPERYRQHGSPTVLVNGRDVTGEEHPVAAMACRADGAPSVDTIAAALL